MFKRTLISLVAFSFAFQAIAEEKEAPAPAAAPKDAKAILTAMDDEYAKAQDMDMKQVFTVYKGDKVEKVVEAEAKQKIPAKRLIRILKPAADKGMAILVEDAGSTFVYLPKFNKTRRVASHSKNQSFLGTDITEKDIAVVRYDDGFIPEFIEETAEFYKLKLTPKPNFDFGADFFHIYIDKKNKFMTKLEAYNADGELLKVQTRDKMEIINGAPVQRLVTWSDIQKGTKTVMEMVEVKINTGMPDSVFTKRNLEWGK